MMLPHFHPSKERHIETGSSSSNRLLTGGDSDGPYALPPELHRKIFSLLPITDAFKAGSSCRMWRTTWYSLPKLIFDYNLFPGVQGKLDTFVKFIDQTLARHDKSVVEEFELWLWPAIHCDFPIKLGWIIFAIRHQVQKLVLYGKINKGPSLNFLFSCQSLVKLELAIENLVPVWFGTSKLPNLRKLKMKFLVLSDQTLTQDLFSCFPALEKLSIILCDVQAMNVLSISSSKLKEFIMCNCTGMENCTLKFQTPPMSRFIYINMESVEVELNIPEHVFGLVINAGDVHQKSENIYNLCRSAIKVTRELLKASNLVINHRLLEYLSMAHDLPRQMAGAGHVFNNLVVLDMTLWPIVEHVRTMLLLVSRCACLTELFLEIVDLERETHDLLDVDDDLIDFVVEGGFCSLYNIRINNFGGSDIENMLVRLLLAYSSELDLMRIVMNTHMVANDVLSKILEFQKASASADVMVMFFGHAPH